MKGTEYTLGKGRNTGVGERVGLAGDRGVGKYKLCYVQ